MLKTFAVALVALAISVGWAQAQMMHHKHMIPGCTPGAAATARCACGTASGKPLVCHPGQWCHPGQACTA
jgi:hypothetical protein